MSRNENCVGPADELVRCSWAGSDPLYRAYHDKEWGVPSCDERHLFEMLNLEGAQAGLSWITILKKRENYARPSTASIRRKWRATTRRRSRRCSPIRGSCAIA